MSENSSVEHVEEIYVYRYIYLDEFVNEFDNEFNTPFVVFLVEAKAKWVVIYSSA